MSEECAALERGGTLVEIARFDFDSVDVKVGDINIAGSKPVWR